MAGTRESIGRFTTTPSPEFVRKRCHRAVIVQGNFDRLCENVVVPLSTCFDTRRARRDRRTSEVSSAEYELSPR